MLMEKLLQLTTTTQQVLLEEFLSEKVNWLERQWELGSYGHLSKPPELTRYQENPPAFTAVGKVTYK